jgi:hypothetical protein
MTKLCYRETNFREKKKKMEQYKSAQFIEDSDEEYGDMVHGYILGEGEGSALRWLPLPTPVDFQQ